MKKYSYDMMKALRGRWNLEENDESQDDEIMKMPPRDVVLECTTWFLGDPGWALRIASWIRQSKVNVVDL